MQGEWAGRKWQEGQGRIEKRQANSHFFRVWQLVGFYIRYMTYLPESGLADRIPCEWLITSIQQFTCTLQCLRRIVRVTLWATNIPAESDVCNRRILLLGTTVKTIRSRVPPPNVSSPGVLFCTKYRTMVLRYKQGEWWKSATAVGFPAVENIRNNIIFDCCVLLYIK